MTQVYDASTPETSRLIGEALDGAWYCERCLLVPITADPPSGSFFTCDGSETMETSKWTLDINSYERDIFIMTIKEPQRTR